MKKFKPTVLGLDLRPASCLLSKHGGIVALAAPENNKTIEYPDKVMYVNFNREKLDTSYKIKIEELGYNDYGGVVRRKEIGYIDPSEFSNCVEKELIKISNVWRYA